MNTTLPNNFRWERIWHVAGPVFGAAWLASPTVAWATTDPPGWQIVLVAVGIAAFASLFLYVAMSQGPVWPPVLAMLAIGVTLTLAADPVFGWLFVWAGSAAGVRLAGPVNLMAVAGSRRWRPPRWRSPARARRSGASPPRCSRPARSGC